MLMAHGIQTANSHLAEKVQLRLETIRKIPKNTIQVLECFAGDGCIWQEVKLHTDKHINILRIVIIKSRSGAC